MEAVSTSETLVNFYQTTRRYNPEDSHLRTHRRENLKSYTSKISNYDDVKRVNNTEVKKSDSCYGSTWKYKNNNKFNYHEWNMSTPSLVVTR
jgi:hypothetical protein